MCGLTGFYDPSRTLGNDRLEAIAAEMATAICHRGPDDGGVWTDERAGIALASRRLAIIDLSPAGHQPMRSVSDRFVMAFNGEIYNFQDLRRELENASGSAIAWRGGSDTEVLLAAIERWGVPGAIRRAIGMFAVALWDRQEQRLTLARDRMGEKPLYYGWSNGVFLFGSELKTIRAHPAFAAAIDHDALALFLRHGYIADPWCIFRGFRKLMPGSFLELDRQALASGTMPSPVTYWSVRGAVRMGQAEPFNGSDDEARVHLDALLRDAVRKQMVSDVPLGAFLSGGVDSSTIVGMMQAQSSAPVKTFTIGFSEKAYNEAEHAAAVARHLGTEHTELYVTPNDALATIPSLPDVFDEPFADASQIPTLLVSQLARRHVTVSLSGDAGDELFGGYRRYAEALRRWDRLEHIPARHALAGGIDRIPDNTVERVLKRMPSSIRQKLNPDRLDSLAALLRTPDRSTLYAGQLGSRYGDETFARYPAPLSRTDPLLAYRDDDQAFADAMMAWDLVTYLPGDILVKIDRASMAASLEARVPLLDHRVVEFAWRLPLSMKLRDGQGKWLLRQVLDQYVPRHLIDRPKQGFGVPIETWLRGPLRNWAGDLLSPASLRQHGLLQEEPVQRFWNEHQTGARSHETELWYLLMFQAWYASSALAHSAPAHPAEAALTAGTQIAGRVQVQR